MDVIIGPRLLPAVRVADATISVEPLATTRYGKPCWRWYVDGPNGVEATGDDLAGWGNAGKMLETLLAFLEASAESYPDGENADLFPRPVVEWAHRNADALAVERLSEGEG